MKIFLFLLLCLVVFMTIFMFTEILKQIFTVFKIKTTFFKRLKSINFNKKSPGVDIKKILKQIKK